MVVNGGAKVAVKPSLMRMLKEAGHTQMADTKKEEDEEDEGN